LNPSSADLDNNGTPTDCLIHYIPEQWKKSFDDMLIKKLSNKGLTYDRYFKKPYELFLNSGYSPIWTNQKYQSSIKSKLAELGININIFKNCPDSKKYIIFSDLINYKEKNANEIQDLFNDNNFKNRVLEYFMLQLKYFNSKIVLINNAFASKLVMNHLIEVLNKERKIYTSLKFQNHFIIFSALITGKNPMDNFSLERLKNEIKVKMPCI
ncbi:MAG: hypothetical protein WCO84_09960, partial [bacterium]